MGAFIELRPDGTSLEVLDLSRAKSTLWRFRGLRGNGLSWSRSGEEVWFTEHGSSGAAGHSGPGPAEISAVALGGRRRVLARLTGPVTLNDMSGDGRVLVTVGDWHNNLVVRAPGETGERDLSWLDQTSEALLSRDGRTVLFNDREGIYLRGTDGSPAVRVGEGVLPSPWMGRACSPSRDQIRCNSRLCPWARVNPDAFPWRASRAGSPTGCRTGRGFF